MIVSYNAVDLIYPSQSRWTELKVCIYLNISLVKGNVNIY